MGHDRGGPPAGRRGHADPAPVLEGQDASAGTLAVVSRLAPTVVDLLLITDSHDKDPGATAPGGYVGLVVRLAKDNDQLAGVVAGS